MSDGDEAQTRNGPIVLVIAAVIGAAGVAGYFLLRGEDAPADAPHETASTAPKRPSEVVDTRDRPPRDASIAVEAPASGPPAPAPAPAIAGLPVIAKRADGREIPPALTSQFSTQVTAAIRECGKSIPAENRPHSRMTGVLTLGITGGSARIVRSNMTLSDVPDGPEKTATLDCLRTKIVGLTQSTTEADVADYEIAVSMLLFPGATGAAKKAAAAAGSGSGSAVQSPPPAK